jgi:uncharacterized protein YcnI
MLAACWSAAPASAHPGLETREAPVGAPYKAVVKIPHGCDGSATIKVRVQIPEGVIGVKPMLKPGWTIQTVRGPYAKTYPHYHGAKLSEGVKELIWTGKLPDDHFDEFVFSGFLADTLTAGTTLYFPTVQDCEKGSAKWIEVPAPGQDAHQLASPAPGLRLLPGRQKVAATGATYKVGALVIEAPWARATPRGARVGGAYMKITNTGPEIDRLTGGTVPIAGTVEVHEMSMTDNVMRMRRLDAGLEIKPGETVELKPGGYHIMLMDLRQALVQGDALKGTLVFEKAGTVHVEYKVAPLGAQGQGAAGAGGHSHH